MRKKLLLTIFLIALCVGHSPGKRNQVIATITEIQGKAEIKKEENWQDLHPLEPLYDGDFIRIKGKAVLMYLGISTEVIGVTNSPYIVRKRKFAEGRFKKVLKKVKRNLSGLIMPQYKYKIKTLGVRSGSEKIKIIMPPNKTSILFPKNFIRFKWIYVKEPYDESSGTVYFRIHQRLKKKKTKTVYEQLIENIEGNNSLMVPGSVFREGATYQWSFNRQKLGTFYILGKKKGNSILSETSHLLKEMKVPQLEEPYGSTFFLIQYSLFIEKGLHYDAIKNLYKLHKENPANETLTKIVKLYERNDW
ncbi:MAG: DUF928 domain-containing protein [Candidatus Aminicenantes bacterium]|jgi:hypothetical protein